MITNILDEKNIIENTRVKKIIPMISPICMLEMIPLTPKTKQTVYDTRNAIKKILNGEDDRVILICGPCSIHDVKSAYEYAKKLYTLAEKVKDNVLIIMRTYFEKPRTTYGWKGLINDPFLNDTCKINDGMSMARKLLLDINTLGLPCGYEVLDTATPQYISDLVSWAAVGARTTESQVHRQLASGLSMPVGFKNGTRGSIDIAINAMISSQQKHFFLGITKQGMIAVINTEGNEDTHIILRGGADKPNYGEKFVREAVEGFKLLKLRPRIMIDCSHGNSGKDYRNQPKVLENVCNQISYNHNICGVMIESNLVEGKQKLKLGKSDELVYGKSITDSCINFEETEMLVMELADAQGRRSRPNKIN